MLDNTNVSIPELAALFGFMGNPKTTLFWLKGIDNRQLYVGPQYQAIWERSCESLYEHPESWRETLLPVEVSSVLEKMSARKTKDTPFMQEVLYRIQTPLGMIKCIRDYCIKLYDTQGNIKSFAGISQIISADEWQNRLNLQTNSSSQNNTLQQLDQLIAKLLDNPIPKSPVSFDKKSSYEIKTILGTLILSRREAQCLYYLAMGKSAKETGNLLFLSQRTVETYLDAIKRKVNCRTKLEIFNKIDIHSIPIFKYKA